MKTRSRILAFILAVFMVVSLVPVMAVTSSAADVATTYGKIPDAYSDATKYPFAIFWDGKFMGAYEWYSDNNDSDGVNSAIERARQLTYNAAGKGIEITILLRSDYTMEPAESTGRDRFNNGSHLGTVTIDLNNHTFTTVTQAMFAYSAKQTFNDTVYANVNADSYITVKNGTINVKGTVVSVSTDTRLDNATNEKNAHFTFDNVTFKQGATGYSIISVTDSVAQSKTYLNVDAKFNNCEFDYSATTNNVTIFNLYNNKKNAFDAVAGVNYADNSLDLVRSTVSVKGGNISATSLANITINDANVGSDTLVFEKDTSGKFTTLTVPADYTVPTDKWVVTRENGADVSANFTGAETVNGDKKVVTLSKQVLTKGQAYMTPYGLIPASAVDPDTTPFAVFANGTCVGVHSTWTKDSGSALAKARDHANPTSSANKDVQILMLRDYTVSTANGDSAYNNLAHFANITTIDLGGHTMTLANNIPFIYACAQTLSSSPPAYRSEFIIKNGTIETGGAQLIKTATAPQPGYMAKYTGAVGFVFNFNGVTINLSTSNNSLITSTINTGTDNGHGGDFDFFFNDSVIDFSKNTTKNYVLFSGTDSKDNVEGVMRSRVDVTIRGGALKGDLNSITLFVGDKNDSFAFDRALGGRFTDLVSSDAYDNAIPTRYDGDMYYVASATSGVYELVYKTPYGNIPQQYEAITYPFAVFADGVFQGAYAAWMKDNNLSAMWKARDLSVNSSINNIQIVMRRNYVVPSITGDASAEGIGVLPWGNNVYGNMGHFSKPLTIDLGSYSFSTANSGTNTKSGMPFLNLKAQAMSSTYPENVNITVKGGTIITQGSTFAIIGFTQNVTARDKYYTKAQSFNLTFEGTTFQISQTNGREFINIKNAGTNTNDKAIGANFNFTFNDCTFDSSKRGSTGKYNPIIASSTENRTNVVINGGKFTFSNNSAISDAIVDKGSADTATLKFGTYNGAYTQMVVPTANTNYDPSGKVYTGTNGEKVVFNLTETVGSNKVYTVGSCAHTDGTSCTVACTICGDTLPHSFEGANWVTTDAAQHWKECTTCPDGNKAKAEVGDHEFTNDCDTTCNVCNATRAVGEHQYTDDCDDSCNECGDVRTAPHSYKTTYETDANDHWIICSECNATKPGSVVAHSGGTATCVSKAVCDTCGVEYGDFSTTNHDTTEAEWSSNGDGNHSYKCTCGASLETEACEGGEATCISKAVCSICNAEYGDYDPSNHDDTDAEWISNGSNGHNYICACGDVLDSEACYGGNAPTCIAKSVCDVCGGEYGNVDYDNHDTTGVTDWMYDDNSHCQTCNCGTYINHGSHYSETWISEGDVHYKNCDTCGASFDYGVCSGSSVATCIAKAVCDTCSNEYGTFNPNNHDTTDVTAWESDGNIHWQICNCDDYINVGSCFGGEADCGNLAVCEICGNEYGDIAAGGHKPDGVWYTENGVHWQLCTVAGCNEKVYEEACSGGYATCSEKAVCSFCEEEYGDLEPHEYSGDCDANCDFCGDERTTTAAHTYQNSCDKTCDVCRAKRTITHTYTNACDDSCNICFAIRTPAAHTGGSATCTEKATCSVCGEKYGDLGEHAYGAAWNISSATHWHECSCGARKDEAAHIFGEWVENDGVRVKTCNCGYAVTATVPAEKKGANAGVVASVTIGASAAVGGIAIGLWTLFSKKTLG